MKVHMRNTLLIFAAGTTIGFLLLVLVFLIPMDEHQENAAASIEILNTEGWYPKLPMIRQFDGSNQEWNSAGILDNFTDSVMIYSAVDDTEGSPLYRAMNVYSSLFPEGYSYYWHGYLTLLRPLLLFMNYADIRVLNSLLQMLLVMLLCCLLYRKKGLVWAMLGLTGYALLMPMTLAFSLQYSWVFYIGMAGSIVAVRFRDFLQEKGRLFYFFLILGMLTSYFDLLTYPLFTWAMPMLWVIVCGKKERESKGIKRLAGGGIFWILGYGGFWLVKWLLAQVFLRKDVIAAAFNEVQYRAGMLDAGETSSLPRTVSLALNWHRNENIQTVLLLGGWLLWLSIRYIRKKRVFYPRNCAEFTLVGISPLVWYVVLQNHTYVHSSFTFRIFSITFLAALAMLYTALEADEPVCVRPDRRWKRTVSWLLPAILLLTAGGIALCDRVDYLVHNGSSSHEPVVLGEAVTLEQFLTPAYGEITAFNLGLKAAGSELQGSFIVELWDEDSLCFETALPAGDVKDSGFYYVPAQLKLDQGKMYRLCIYAQGSGDTICYASVTSGGEEPVGELAGLSLDSAPLDGQLIAGIHYRRLPGIKRLMLDVIGWYGGSLSAALVLCYFSRLRRNDF